MMTLSLLWLQSTLTSSRRYVAINQDVIDMPADATHETLVEIHEACSQTGAEYSRFYHDSLMLTFCKG